MDYQNNIRKKMSTIHKQILSVIFTFIIYTGLTNWKVALLLIVGVAFHECCHIAAAKYCKLPTGGFYMIPFMGGVALVTGAYRKYSQQAFVVLMGPIGGGAMAACVAAYFYLTGANSPFWGAAAYWLVFLNLFNLLPLSSMDGGQIVGTVTYSINPTVGLVVKAISNVAAAVVLWFFNPVLVALVIFFGWSEVISEYLNWKAHRKGEYWKVSDTYLNGPKKLSKLEMVATCAAYFGAMAALGILLLILQNHTHGLSDLIKK
jgi:Zn-dependent protease